MTAPLRRAGIFAVVGALSLAAPVLGRFAWAPFMLVAIVTGFIGRFERPTLLGRISKRPEQLAYDLTAFSLAGAALGVLAGLESFAMPMAVFPAAMLILTVGGLAQAVFIARGYQRTSQIGAFVITGTVGGFASIMLVHGIVFSIQPSESLLITNPTLVVAMGLFLASAGALLAGLLRSVFYGRDTVLILLSIGLLMWLLASIQTKPDIANIATAVVVTAGLVSLARWLNTASITGLLTGALLAFLTISLGGLTWFAVLFTFFGVGGLATKYRYDRKQTRGVAEENAGARGSGNVLGNASVALFAVLGFATAGEVGQGIPPGWFQYAFIASLAGALSDTLSSEYGCLFDSPRLITTLEVVEPGTDGGVTWQGAVAGVVGAALIGLVAHLVFRNTVPMIGIFLITTAGFLGMVVDSVLGATLEGQYLGNQSVNFIATTMAAIWGVLLGLSFELLLAP